MTIEEKAFEIYPVKYQDDHRGERKHPDLNKPLRDAWLAGVKYTVELFSKQLERIMTVKELIASLKQMPQDAEVVAFDEASSYQPYQDAWMKEAVEVNVDDLTGDLFNYCMEQGLTKGDRVRILILSVEGK